ncbi:uncharacterized protein [Hyperolius riggenbachi]|uniref:uncharacterized protein n=1 Tax=Hyperolius riggenbachi TaxID=752182 RepID=UPI0035A36134
MESATITDTLQATENTGKSSLTQMEESDETAVLEGPREPENTGKSSLTQMEESNERAVLEDPGDPENTGKSSLTRMEESAEMEELEGPGDKDKKISDSWEEIEKLTDDEISASAGKSSGSLVIRGSGSSVKIQIDTNTEIEKKETDKQGGQTELSGRTTVNQTGSDADDTPDYLPASRQQSDVLKSSHSFLWSGLAWASEKASSLHSWISSK